MRVEYPGAMYHVMSREELGPGALKVFRGGWYLGDGAFKKQMLGQVKGKLGDHHWGELYRETADAKAERILAQELKRLGGKPGEQMILEGL
jgi:hypothetical protein